jgi:tetratricopeptide (TPR) repeat protein
MVELVDSAREQLQNNDLQPCLKTLERIFELCPNSKDANALERECRKLLEEQSREHEQRFQLPAALAVARKALDREDFERCLRCVSAALELDPEHEEAHTLRREATSRQKLQELAKLAHEHRAADRHKDCLRAIAEGLQLDPEDTNLRQLQEEVRVALRKRREIEGLLEKACRQLEAEAYKEVIDASDQILNLDPKHIRAQELKEQAIRLVDEAEEHSGQINELLEFARQEMKTGNFDSASRNLTFLLELEPDHREARTLLEQLGYLSGRPRGAAELDVKGEEETARKAKKPSLPTVERPVRTKDQEKLAPAETLGQKLQTLAVKTKGRAQKSLAGVASRMTTARSLQVVSEVKTLLRRLRVLTETWAGCLPGAQRLPTGLPLAAIGVLLLLVSWGISTSFSQDQELVPPPNPGTLLLKVSPWARVDSITRVEDGQLIPVDSPITPCVVSLPGGNYQIRVSNSYLGEPFEIHVNLKDGERREIYRTFPGISLEEEISAALAELEE